MKTPGQVGTGGLETSALALGQARAALVALGREQAKRDDLNEPFDALSAAWGDLALAFEAAAAGQPNALPPGEVRARANALVLSCTQAYLTAPRGPGSFVASRPSDGRDRPCSFSSGPAPRQ